MDSQRESRTLTVLIQPNIICPHVGPLEFTALRAFVLSRNERALRARSQSTRGRSLINTRQINANNNIFGHPCHWPSAWCPGPADPNTRTLTSCTLVVRIAHIYFYPVAVKFRLLCSVFDGEIPSTATLCQNASVPHRVTGTLIDVRCYVPCAHLVSKLNSYCARVQLGFFWTRSVSQGRLPS